MLPKDSSMVITVGYSPNDTQKTSAVIKFMGFVCNGGELDIKAEQNRWLGINENSLPDYFDISVFPNPAEDKIKLDISGLSDYKNYFLNEKLKITIYDCLGNKISELGEFNIGENIEISTSNLSAGTYFLNFSGWNFNKFCPFVVYK